MMTVVVEVVVGATTEAVEGATGVTEVLLVVAVEEGEEVAMFVTLSKKASAHVVRAADSLMTDIFSGTTGISSISYCQQFSQRNLNLVFEIV